ncbi:hypothetical protein GSI_12078 [Ganoderma sinense ZZ0214-1]|uniref:Heterokaryon incompatibility domain-containing protein n=1 Tax=Ganoderma sinense ZZ0214-1 TaxID=1077348 RepID=A0A2G8RXT9_9APHY|nr:hypothetical protein GSI_12078 [Ganoderma sinense ZZ0214-1]
MTPSRGPDPEEGVCRGEIHTQRTAPPSKSFLHRLVRPRLLTLFSDPSASLLPAVRTRGYRVPHSVPPCYSHLLGAPTEHHTMWLLSTDRAELRYFVRNFDATGGYAILSHTWDGEEQTLQDVRAIGERCRASGTNPREDPALSAKIRECCLLAERHGYHWVWIDSCCIDKTSSSELSEVINSMFRWYKESEVCFAYLADVSGDCVLDAPDSAFRKSRWHTRGWTLQELVAPDVVIFLSWDWRELGNKAALAKLLQDITNVDARALTQEMKPVQWSIAVRMSWASCRKTTRVEDEAYCLMGLFGVSMPTNYGEGKRAFVRLQYEIMQHETDMSLFAFGYCVQQDRGAELCFCPQEEINIPRRYLMADSPRELRYSLDYIPNLGKNAIQQYPPPPDSGLSSPFDGVDGGIELPRVAVTSYGIKLRLPVYEADGITIAVLLCEGIYGHKYGLFLTRDPLGKDPKRPRYFTGCAYTTPATGSGKFVARTVNLGEDLYNLTFNGKPVKAAWRTFYVVPTISDRHSAGVTTPDLIINCNPASRFRVPRWLVARLTSLQFSVLQVRNTETLQVLDIHLTTVARIYISFGSCCVQHERDCDVDGPPQLWARVEVLLDHVRTDTFPHDCSEDHVDSESWAPRSKIVGDTERAVRLALMPSTREPDSAFVVHLELLGDVFKEMLQEPGVPSLFPSVADLERNALRPAPNDPIQVAPAPSCTHAHSKPSSSGDPPSTSSPTPLSVPSESLAVTWVV